MNDHDKKRKEKDLWAHRLLTFHSLILILIFLFIKIKLRMKNKLRDNHFLYFLFENEMEMDAEASSITDCISNFHFQIRNY
jgi:hypothetical protein